MKEQTAIVTGGNSGIGKAIATRLAEAGWRIIVAGRREEKNREVADNLNRKYAGEVMPMRADVSEEEDCQTLVKKAQSAWGRLDLLVNNAGIGPSSTTMAEGRTEDLERVMRTNVYGPFWCSKHAWNLLDKNEPDARTGVRGSIIHVASLCSVDAWAGIGFYAMSKHALLALSKTLSDEGTERAIRSTAICPALVATPMNDPEDNNAITPDDIAGTVMYLLSLSSNAWPTELVINRRGAD
ncbi:MAG: SDR family oxidoreductase [Oceanipulchritudo sp.]